MLVPDSQKFSGQATPEEDQSSPAHPFEYESQAPTVLVGVPAYNESSTIREVVNKASDYADEVLVVDDGSTDRTREQARTAGAMVISHTENQGYGVTLGTIFRYAHQSEAEHLVIIDADGQHDVDDIPELVKIQEETGVEIVTGSRFSGGVSTSMPRYRRFGLGVINLFANLVLRVGYSSQPVSDSQCGFRAYDSDAIESMATASDIGSGMGASLDILFRAAREGHDIVEVPTHVDYHVENANTRNSVVHGLSLLTSVCFWLIHDRPVRIATVAVFSLLSFGLFVVVVSKIRTTVLYALLIALAVVFLFLYATVSQQSWKRTDSTDHK